MPHASRVPTFVADGFWAGGLQQEDADEAEGDDPLGGTVETGVTALVERVMRTEGLLPARPSDSDAATAEERRVLEVRCARSPARPLASTDRIDRKGCDWGRGSYKGVQRGAGSQPARWAVHGQIASSIGASSPMRSMEEWPGDIQEEKLAATHQWDRQLQEQRCICGVLT